MRRITLALLIAFALVLANFYLVQNTLAGPGDPPGSPAAPASTSAMQDYIQRTFGKQPAAAVAEIPYSLDPQVLAKAQPDECFNGVGQPYSGTVGTDCASSIYVAGTTQPKVNQAYVWGLVKSADNLYFGTAPNVHCLVIGGALVTTTVQTSSYVCEFGQSQYSPPAPEALGDWRPPEAYVYNLTSNTLTNISPISTTATLADVTRFKSTLGLRSAGTISNTIFMGGPVLGGGGINLFAFDATTGAFLSSTTLTDYTNIRKWVPYQDALYLGVRKGTTAGAVLRYTGDPSDPARRFEFAEVGTLGSEAAELAIHEGRLFISTWPTGNLPNQWASLWMSPLIPTGGLTAADATAWQKVWTISDYEPEPVVARYTGGGALASYGGYLYWGTMHVPFVAAKAFLTLNPPQSSWSQEEILTYVVNTALGTHRAISIFRGKDFGGTSQSVELLYGESELPVFQNQTWTTAPNKMGATPTYGGSGFGNFYNNYTWTMQVHKGSLFVGTMDWGYLAEDGAAVILDAMDLPTQLAMFLPGAVPGADLYRFLSPNEAAQPAALSGLTGLGNPTNYGIRTMLSDDSLYLGMANPMNLLARPTDTYKGGWELIRMNETLPPPDLKLTKTASSDLVAPGQTFTYRLSVTNQSSYGPAANTLLSDWLPPETTFITASVSGGTSGACSELDHLVTCSIGTLGVNGTLTNTASAIITVTAPAHAGWLLNTASVSNDLGDQNNDDNEAILWTTVDLPSDLEISKTAGPVSVDLTRTLVYSLNVTNLGPNPLVANLPLTLTNPNPIAIPTFGLASPYPSAMTPVSGIQGTVAKATVTLKGLAHNRLSDLNFLLVGPQDQKVLLMSGVGDGFYYGNGLTFTFDDDAAGPLPASGAIISGTYQPTNYTGAIPNLMFPMTPTGTITTSLSSLKGADPNGVWRLYAVDDLLIAQGEVQGGWQLNLTINRSATVTDDLPAGLVLQSVSAPAGWTCTTVDPLVCTAAGDLPVGTTYPIVLTTTVTMDAPIKFTNTAQVSTAAVDPGATNNKDSATAIAPRLFLPVTVK